MFNWFLSLKKLTYERGIKTTRRQIMDECKEWVERIEEKKQLKAQKHFLMLSKWKTERLEEWTHETDN